MFPQIPHSLSPRAEASGRLVPCNTPHGNGRPHGVLPLAPRVGPRTRPTPSGCCCNLFLCNISDAACLGCDCFFLLMGMCFACGFMPQGLNDSQLFLCPTVVGSLVRKGLMPRVLCLFLPSHVTNGLKILEPDNQCYLMCTWMCRGLIVFTNVP